MTDRRVSVIIPNYNYSQYLGEAIDSVLAQTYSPIEIIVVDDGSTDGSREVLESYGDRVTAIFQQNAGVSAARNNGVSQSHGEFVAFLDADDAWLPAKVELQMQVFADDAGIGLSHVGVVEIDGRGNRLVERIDGMCGRVADALLRFERPVILGGGSGLMVPRRVFDEIGGFDMRLSTSADWDMFYQVSSRYSVGFVPEILLKYRFHLSNMHANIAAMEHDMLLGFEKAFAGGSSAERSKCYGNLYKMLAGSYFRSRKYPDFVRNAFKSIANRPANFGYFLQFPLRRLQTK
jgi:glycosyltransferase involved in cell wall biosynthesis